MTRRAWSTSSADGVHAALAGSTWLGMDQRLAVEAHLDTLAALGGEALGVVDVVVHAVEDRRAGLAGGEHGGGQVRREVRSPGDGEWGAQLAGAGRWCRSRAR